MTLLVFALLVVLMAVVHQNSVDLHLVILWWEVEVNLAFYTLLLIVVSALVGAIAVRARRQHGRLQFERNIFS